MLTDNQKLRYSRNIALSQIDQQGQELLLDSHVTIVGVGGLGALISSQLSAMGVGNISIIDSDRIELSNLQRQITFSESDIGRLKTESLKDFILARNSDCKITIINNRLNENNAKSLLGNTDIIADASDNFKTRFIINKTAFNLRTILVSAAVIEWGGQISTFKAFQGKENPCYQCFCPEIPPEDSRPDCSSNGVVGSVAAVMASLQATEIIKELLGIEDGGLSGKILRYNALSSKFSISKLKKLSSCSICNN